MLCHRLRILGHGADSRVNAVAVVYAMAIFYAQCRYPPTCCVGCTSGRLSRLLRRPEESQKIFLPGCPELRQNKRDKTKTGERKDSPVFVLSGLSFRPSAASRSLSIMPDSPDNQEARKINHCSPSPEYRAAGSMSITPTNKDATDRTTRIMARIMVSLCALMVIPPYAEI